jgi:ankyrin repeat protein
MARREKELGFIASTPDAGSVHVDDILSLQDFTLVDTRRVTFSFVKNPYTRALSAYLDKIHPAAGNKPQRALFCSQYALDPSAHISFHHFLHCISLSTASEQDPHWRSQACNLLLGGLAIDFVGHVEHFDEDSVTLAKMTGLNMDSTSISAGRQHGTSAKSRLADFYGDRELSLANKIYEEDFRVFGYRFDPASIVPVSRGLRFEMTDPFLHHFIAGVGLHRMDPLAALTELRSAESLTSDSSDLGRISEIVNACLGESIAKGDASAVEALLAAGLDPNARLGSDRSPLFNAAWLGRADIVEMLVRAGADLNAITGTGVTALIAAATNGHLETARYLTSNGGHIDARDRDGTTALMVAAWNGHRSVVDVLLSFAADANLVRADGRTAVMMATMAGHNQIVELLARNGANVNVKNAIGNTPLMIAAWSGNRDLVELLLSLGAEVGANRNDGLTAIDLAQMGKHQEIVTLLVARSQAGKEQKH